MIDREMAKQFLASGRIAVIGPSDDPKNFGGAVLRAMADHGIEVIAVNPNHDEVAGHTCYHAIGEVPGDLDGVLVMVSGRAAVDAVGDAVAHHVPRVWLFKGIGGAGAVSPEAVELCKEHDTPVVAGACPLMFLEPVKGVHRLHRGLRRLNGSVP
jgi:predicted CoA-binding protein